MPKLHYRAEDLLRGILIEEAGWYPVVVSGTREEPAATDNSQNYIVDLVIEDGKHKGVPLMRYFNEKAPGFITDFADACGIKLEPGGGDFDFDLTKGKHIDVFIEQRKDNKGNLQNNAARFRRRQQAVA